VSDSPLVVSVGAGMVALALNEGDVLTAEREKGDAVQPPPMDPVPIEEAPLPAPAETETPAEIEVPPREVTPRPEGPPTLRDLLDSIEARANADPPVLEDGTVLMARVGDCATGTPSSWHRVDDDTPAQRGMTVLCTSSSEPQGHAEVGERLVVVLDDTGTVATQVSTDGSTSQPFLAPEGMLCRDYLANFHPDDQNRGQWVYTELLAYWFLEGAPERMDIDHNDVPCETLFPPDVVADVWAGDY
jgi:hypothetical protein